MRAADLHVVTVVANPIRWQSRIRLARQFVQHMLDSGVQVTLVECTYGDRPYELADLAHVNPIPVRSKTLVWNKESMVNAGIARLPANWKTVAWIDPDIAFRRPTCAADTVDALQRYDFVQPWADCYDLGPTTATCRVTNRR